MTEELMPYTAFATKPAPEPPPIRSKRQDWIALTLADQLCVAAHCQGDLPLGALSAEAATFVRRHHGDVA